VIFISEFARETGILTGLAIGDALGAPFECLPPPRRYVTAMEACWRYPGRKGKYTDDTLQALAVARSLVQCRGFSQDDMMIRLLEGYNERPEFFGPTSSAVFELVLAGTAPGEATRIVHERNRGSRSNGSVMRGAPLGIMFEGEELHEISILCSRLTHFDPVAGECSAFLNQMAAGLVRGHNRDQAFVRALARCGDDTRPPVPGLDALECTHAALTCFMEGQSFEDAVLNAINLGGDADTVGACTGTLAGAYWGIDAIPGRWKQELEDYPLIVAVAIELARVARK